jgi:hypothetical protein
VIGKATLQWTGDGTVILHMPLLTSYRRLPLVVDPDTRALAALDLQPVAYDPEPGEVRGCVIGGRFWCWKACEGTHDSVGTTIIDALDLDQRGCGARILVRISRFKRPLWRCLDADAEARALVTRLLRTPEAEPTALPTPAH